MRLVHRLFSANALMWILFIFLALPAQAFAQTVNTADLFNGAVTNQKLAPNSVGKNKIKNGAVTSAKIKDGTILLQDLDPSIPTQGPQGEQGIPGINGTNGADGVDGTDGTDGVQITFAQEVDYDPGTGSVPSLDLNGTSLHISGATSTVTLGGTPLTVLFQGTIPDSVNQQVIVQLPGGLLPGDYRIALQNSQGVSAFDSTLGETSSGGGSGSIPSGAVMHFNLASCPANWTFLTTAQGRYLVGVTIGGTVGLTVGTGFIGSGKPCGGPARTFCQCECRRKPRAFCQYRKFWKSYAQFQNH